jgi:enediyne biosynthesis protein E4
LANWIDYDNDGDLDIYIWQSHFALYLNSGNGFFTRTFEGSIANEREDGWGCRVPIWADYDNDGYPDLLVIRPGGTNTLHHNLYGTNSVEVTHAAGLDQPMNTISANWGDYDNDGDLDLFIVNNFRWGTPPLWRSANVLYQNNGDGTFTEVDVGSPIWEGSDKWDTSWIDYDNDGFLDLFIGSGQVVPEVNYLYRNNLSVSGNTNHWLKVSLVGKASNASGIGAKVRVTANIRGQTVTQLRPIEATGILGGSQGLLAHFGLGDATSVTTLRTEWPSGIVQELPNVAANQFLTVVECQGYTNTPPAFAGATKDASGLQLAITEPAAGARYILEASTDMVTWTKLLARTSAGGTCQFTNINTASYPKRFYRLQVP